MDYWCEVPTETQCNTTVGVAVDMVAARVFLKKIFGILWFYVTRSVRYSMEYQMSTNLLFP